MCICVALVNGHAAAEKNVHELKHECDSLHTQLTQLETRCQQQTHEIETMRAQTTQEQKQQRDEKTQGEAKTDGLTSAGLYLCVFDFLFSF